jgi:glycosyltransferase involved in cell wall biosynthesis
LLRSSSSSPIVSVILPTYNRATLVTRAIESVLGQEFADLELIVVDDGSTDETSKVISKIDDKRLRYMYFEQNRGETFARNQGIQQARGKLIAQMDSDDLWYPPKTAYQVDLFNRYEHLDLIFCNMLDINHITNKKVNYFKQVDHAFQRLQVRDLDREAWEILGGLPEALLVSTIIPHPTVMFRRSMLESIGRYNENLRGGGDFEYWWRAALKGVKFAYTSRIFLDRRVDMHSLTADRLALNVRHLQALEICEQTAQDLGRMDLYPQLRRANFVTWCRIMFEHIYRAEFRQAISAYKHSLEYGSPFDLLLHISKVTLRRGKEHAGKFYRRMKKEPG